MSENPYASPHSLAFEVKENPHTLAIPIISTAVLLLLNEALKNHGIDTYAVAQQIANLLYSSPL